MVVQTGVMHKRIDESSFGYYGWWIVVVAFINLFFTFGAPTFLLPLVYGDITQEFNWSRAAVTQIATWKFLAAAGFAIFMARIVQQTGLRITIVCGSIVTGLTMLCFYWVQSQFVFYLLGAFLGACAILMVIAMKILVSRWFHERQGFAVGVALIGSSVAGAVIPLIATPIIEAYGWRSAFVAMTLGILFIALPFYLLFGKDRPSDMGYELPVGGRTTDGHWMTTGIADLDATIKEIMMRRKFWFVVIGLFLVGFVDQGLIQHTPLYLEKDLGFSRRAASTAFALTFAVGILAKAGFGWFYDKYSTRGIIVCYILMGIAVLLAFPITGMLTISIFVIVRGLAHGGLVADVPVLAKHCYGNRNLSAMISIFTGILTLGYSAGIYTMGAMYDFFGNYTYAFILLALLSFIAAVLLIWVTPSYWLSLKSAGKS